jgi:hypothetical protein
MLRQHPDVFMCRGEVHFFDKRHNFAKGLDWYRSFFEAATDESAIGEKTPDYFWTNGFGPEEDHIPHVHELVHRTLPHARLIVLLRNPVERAISAVNHLKRHRFIAPRHRIDRLLVGDKREVVRPFGVLDKGFYHRHLKAYCSLYDRSQLLVLIFEEDVLEKPRKGLRKVCRFLNVDASFRFENVRRRVNDNRASPVALALRYYLGLSETKAGRWERRLRRRLPGLPSTLGRPRDETVSALYRFYQPTNKKLFEWLGRKVGAWKRARTAHRASSLAT